MGPAAAENLIKDPIGTVKGAVNDAVKAGESVVNGAVKAGESVVNAVSGAPRMLGTPSVARPRLLGTPPVTRGTPSLGGCKQIEHRCHKETLISIGPVGGVEAADSTPGARSGSSALNGDFTKDAPAASYRSLETPPMTLLTLATLALILAIEIGWLCRSRSFGLRCRCTPLAAGSRSLGKVVRHSRFVPSALVRHLAHPGIAVIGVFLSSVRHLAQALVAKPPKPSLK